jgi:DNA-directed RNA polymerase specialized sigma24 family protein
VVLRYYEDLSVLQIAEELGCAEGTAKRHLADARAKLATQLTLTEETAR